LGTDTRPQLRFFFEYTVQVSGTVQYPQYLNSTWYRSVEDEILFESSDGKLADIGKDAAFDLA
jgi:hypothetical protein